MADVSDPFTLCRTFQKDSLLGIEKHLTKNHVILTFRDRGVLIYNLENKKLVNSLPVQQRREFSSSVVQDPNSEKYIGVLDDLNICQWCENDGNFVEYHQTKVDQPVARVLTTTNKNTEPVVVFRDGSCNVLSECTTSTSTKKTRRKSTTTSLRIMSSSVLHYGNTPIIALAKYKDANLSVSLTKIENGVQFVGEWSIKAPSEGAHLINSCFQALHTSLISYWSNGFVYITDLSDILNSSTSQDQDINLTCKCIHRLHVDSKSSKKPVSIATVDSTHVCMCHEDQTDNGPQETLSILETKFGTRQTSVSLDKLTSGEPMSSMISSSSGSTHIICTDGYICVSSKYGVVACSYTVKESSLATALGKLAPSTRSSEVMPVKPLLCIPHLPDPTKDWKDWIDSTNTSQTTEDEILTKLTNPEKTKTVKSFTQQLNNYLESKCLKKGKDEHIGADAVIKKTPLKAKDKFKSKFLLSQHFVLTVLSRCLEETKFFPKDALTNLIKTRCIPGSSSPDLLKYLTEKNEVSMILVCLKNIQGIPESALVSCIQYITQAENSVFGDKEETEENMVDQTEVDMPVHSCPFGKNQSNLLCHLLSYPVNDVFIQQSIKKLISASVIALMKFLAHIIETAPRTSFAREDSPLSYAIALDWTGWIINAHYTSLVLMPDVHDLLRYMSKSVSDQVSLLQKLGRLEGFLNHYKYKQTLPNNEKTGLYTVEMIEL